MVDAGDGFIAGIAAAGMLFFLLYVTVYSPALATVDELCNQKYGVSNWTSHTEDGYFVCDAKHVVDVQCRVDGTGIERCKTQR